MKKRGNAPRFFVARPRHCEKQSRLSPRQIMDCFAPLAMTGGKPSRFSRRVLYDFGMVLSSTSMVRRRVVIDDRSRLPGRFFGRFATSATSELTRAA